MKKVILIPIILGGVLLVAGAALFAIAIAKNSSSATVVDKTYDLNEDFENIDIKVAISDLSFKASSDGSKKVVLQEREKQYHIVKVENNALNISFRDERHWYEKMFNFDFKPMTVDVYLPAATYGNLKIDSSTGNVNVPKDFSFASFTCEVDTGNVNTSADVTNTLDIKSSTGNISLKDLSSKELKLKASTGNISAKDVTISEDVDINVSTGNVKLEDTTFRDINIKTSTGDVTLTNAVGSGKMIITTSTGDVKFNDADAAEMDIKTSTGYVKGTLLTSKSFSVTSATGKPKYPEFSTGGHCRIETDTGAIDIRIKE